MKKYTKHDQRLMATWAADCAERVLPLFEKAYPQDNRPCKAIEACRTWIHTGVFRMADMRGASLAAHAAAREAKENGAACFAARAAGHGVATAHVAEHGLGGAYFALKAVAAVHSADAEVNIFKERAWQLQYLPKNLRQDISDKILIQKHDDGIHIKLQKGKDF